MQYEPSGSIKCGQCFDQLGRGWPLTMVSAPWSKYE